MHLRLSFRKANEPQSPGRKQYASVAALLGLFGAVNMLLLASGLLNTYLSLSRIPPMEELALPIWAGATGMVASSAMLVCGSLLILKDRLFGGGLINLLAGSLAPIPTYAYFAVFSEPLLLSWLGLSGFLLLAPAIVSGLACVYASRFV